MESGLDFDPVFGKIRDPVLMLIILSDSYDLDHDPVRTFALRQLCFS